MFNFLNVLCFISFAFISPSLNYEIIQLNTITRHGERSPCFSYPQDPFKHKWTKGLGQLTENGINQLNELGLFLRKEYNSLIPEEFHKKRVYIRSSDTDRTIMSALATVSKLFPNQIVPVHSVPKSLDYQLKMTSHCPRHNQLLDMEYEKQKNLNIIRNYTDVFKVLESGTGINNVDIRMSFRICDAVTVWNMLNLDAPSWSSPGIVKKCKELGNLKFIIGYSNPELTKFRGGPLVELILNNMVSKVDKISKGEGGMVLYSYFTHDSTISAFLSHLKIYDGIKPPLASTVLIELLYQYDPNSVVAMTNFAIQIRYRNNSSQAPHPLHVPFCSGVGVSSKYICRLDIFIKHYSGTFIQDMLKQCDESNYFKIISSATGPKTHKLQEMSDKIINTEFRFLKIEYLIWYIFPFFISPLVLLFFICRFCKLI